MLQKTFIDKQTKKGMVPLWWSEWLSFMLSYIHHSEKYSLLNDLLCFKRLTITDYRRAI